MPKKPTQTKVPSVVDRITSDKAGLIEQLKKVPIVQVVCERAGVGRATFYRWCQEDNAFAESARSALYEGKSLVNDLAESQLINGIKDKQLPAISFWLKHNHPDYRIKVEVSQAVPQEALTSEQQSQIAKAIALMTSKQDDRPNTQTTS